VGRGSPAYFPQQLSSSQRRASRSNDMSTEAMHQRRLQLLAACVTPSISVSRDTFMSEECNIFSPLSDNELLYNAQLIAPACKSTQIATCTDAKPITRPNFPDYTYVLCEIRSQTLTARPVNISAYGLLMKTSSICLQALTIVL